MSQMKKMMPRENTDTPVRNPYMGWSAYVEYVCTLHEEHGEGVDTACVDADYPELYFKRLDQEIARGLAPSILYIRQGWIWFEPEKGVYAWKDPDSLLSRYIQGAVDRGLQIAFRIITADNYYKQDETVDNPKQCTPPWLFHEPGFRYYRNHEGSRTPYYDNPVYLHYYEKLICELAADFDRPELVAFADAQGLGVWGEMHDIQTQGIMTVEQTIEEHAGIWGRYFKHILLGACFGGGAERVNEKVIVPQYRHMVRRDGYGSRWITPEFTKMYLETFFPQRISSYAEVCYWHLDNWKELKVHFSQEQQVPYTGDRDRDIRTYLEYCLTDARLLRANVLDARVPQDWPYWTGMAPDLIRLFSMENGYRLVPVRFEHPDRLKANEDWTIGHSWKNTALGFMPIVNNQLSGKYRISFALLSEEGVVLRQWIDEEAEPSWIQEDGVKEYQCRFGGDNLPGEGVYRLAAAIVDITRGGQPAINLAAIMETVNPYGERKKPEGWFGEWYVIDQIRIEV